MDWRYERRCSIRFMQVDRQTMRDVKELDCFLEFGGEIEENDLTATKVAGTLPYIHLPDIGNDYLRVYSVHTQGDEIQEVLHGTFICSAPSSEISRKVHRGNLDIYSRLEEVQDSGIKAPLSIPQNTVAVSYATSLVNKLGLPVSADISAARLTTPWNYRAGTSNLEIVNDLLQFAGFASATVDAYGTIGFHAYTDPSSRAPSVIFRDDEPGCIFAPTVRHDLDYFSVPNVFVATMSNLETDMVATAINDDPASIYSTVSRGREIVATEELSDIESQQALQDFADRRLTELSSSVESVEVTHRFIPYQMGDGVLLSYTEAGFEMSGVAVKRRLVLSPNMLCTTRARRFIRR